MIPPDNTEGRTAQGRTAHARVAGIVLAAGRSRRMGRPKQVLPLGGADTVIQVVTRRLRPHVDTVVVVVGHVAGQVAALLAADEVTLAVNDDVDRGMLSSVQCGLRAAGPDRDGYLVCLGDQPGVEPAILAAITAAAAQADKGIVMPTFGGRRGHPVYLARRYYEEILSLGDDVGLNTVTRAHPEDTLEVPVAAATVLDDMDTPDDYERECRRYAPT